MSQKHLKLPYIVTLLYASNLAEQTSSRCVSEKANRLL